MSHVVDYRMRVFISLRLPDTGIGATVTVLVTAMITNVYNAKCRSELSLWASPCAFIYDVLPLSHIVAQVKMR